MQTPTLYEWAGGKESLEGLTKFSYEKVLKDDVPYPVFKNMSPEHSEHVAHFIGEVFEGPEEYTNNEEPMPKWGWDETGGPYTEK